MVSAAARMDGHEERFRRDPYDRNLSATLRSTLERFQSHLRTVHLQSNELYSKSTTATIQTDKQ